MSVRMFPSYRREDSSGHTGRLYDRLSDHFGEAQIVRDVETTEPGLMHCVLHGPSIARNHEVGRLQALPRTYHRYTARRFSKRLWRLPAAHDLLKGVETEVGHWRRWPRSCPRVRCGSKPWMKPSW